MPETRKMPNAKFSCQPLSKNAKFEEFGTKNAKLAALPLVLRFAKAGGYLHERTCNRTHFKQICSLPLVHRPKGVLLVIITSHFK